MRVLQVVTDTDRRGAQVFASDLHGALEELGWDVETVALTDGHVGGLDLPALGRGRRSPRTILALRGRVRGADVVIAHGSTTLPVTALATIGLPCPLVYRQVSDSLFWAPTRARRARVRAAFSRVAMVVALWEGAARVLIDRFGLPRGKVRIAPNAVRTGDWTPASHQERLTARRRLRLPPDRPVVTFAAAMAHEKGPDLAVETIAATSDAQLLMVGAGPEDRRTRALAGQLLGDRVTFLGSTRDMREVYAATDVLLFPSRGGDSMPAVVIEAGLMGVPTVATDTGALASMIEPDVTGRLVAGPHAGDLARALHPLVLDPARRRAMGSAAHDRFLKRFDVRVVARQWAMVLDEVIGSRSTHHHAEARTG